MKTRLEVFKTGTHTAMDGKKYTFSSEDLAQIAAAYDPALFKAPHVIGHPKVEDPAYAWAAAVIAEGDTLYVESDEIDPAFSEMVDAGRFKNRSIKLWGPNDPGNPKPGGYYLRHIGWLGATPPAVKGLAPAFGAGDDHAGVEFSDGAADGFWVKDLFRGIRDWIIDEFGLEKADKVVPAWAVDNIDRSDRAPGFAEGEPLGEEAEAAPAVAQGEPPQDEADPAFAERERQLADRESALQAREAAIAAREAQTTASQVAFAEGARQASRGDDDAFVDQLVAQGRMSPVRGAQAKALLARLDGDASVAFADPDTSARDQFRDLLGELGVSIHFSEFAPSEGARFAEAPSAEQIAAQIREEQAKAAGRGETLSASQAAARIGR
ncbi:hypothetical protein OVA11_14210 [Caulobacter sp. SL161]|uniref:hypothetical protein n=1 Tax=Caulobacter sp. SL161 TaxID=2995156 RepID=UPI0022734C7A|nr:hypothetical protein [Caulobacter sp. SL161]MCY1648174.1 hypothetical protein [Caulobacter sp. SL161]